MQNFKRYYDAITYLEALPNLTVHNNYMLRGKRLSDYLKRMNYFLKLLGDPHKGFKYIHVTGTAGKGTVTNMLHEVLHASNKKVGSFTSPFVSTSIEKIRVKDSYISPDEFADIVDQLIPVIDHMYVHGPFGRPSYFEIFFAAALLYFKKQKCEWVVLEVGCGGRYDATNVIESPQITAITCIDYDHTEILGKTLQKIAYEKMGIIKQGSVFFTTEKRPHLLKMFKSTCKNRDASYHPLSPLSSFSGTNELLVRSIAEYLNLDSVSITKGIEAVKLQCRFEIIQSNPTVILDGAHNRIKMRSTAANLSDVKFKKLHLICGLAENKNGTEILHEIIPHADHVYFTRAQVKERRFAHPTQLLKQSKKYSKPAVKVAIFLHPLWALNAALAHAKKDDLILVTGSFFLSGELRKQWIPEEKILGTRKLR